MHAYVIIVVIIVIVIIIIITNDNRLRQRIATVNLRFFLYAVLS